MEEFLYILSLYLYGLLYFLSLYLYGLLYFLSACRCAHIRAVHMYMDMCFSEYLLQVIGLQMHSLRTHMGFIDWKKSWQYYDVLKWQ